MVKDNPWSDAGNQAVGAIYKHYMSQPSAAEIQEANLKNRLLDARYGTEMAQQKKYGLEADGLEMRNAAPKRVSEMMGKYINQSAPQSAPAPTGDIHGRLYNDLQSELKLSPAVTAGIVGNLDFESGGFNNLQELEPMVPGSRGGYGYAQWTGPRRKQFEQFSTEQGLDPASYEANKGFLVHELQNTPEGAVLASLQGVDTPDNAAQIFANEFLRPGIPHTDQRIDRSRQIYNQFSPEMVETAMQAAIESPAQAADVLQMMGGAMQLPPEIMSNIQQGAGVNYANTEEGFERDLNKLKTVSAGSHIYDPVTNQSVFNAPTKQGGGSSVTLADGTVIDIDGGSGGKTEATKATMNKIQPAQIDLQILKDTIGVARGLAQESSNLGIPGRMKGAVQDTRIILSGVTDSLGYEQPEQYFDEMMRKETSKTLAEGDTQNYLNELYDPRIDSLKKTQIILAYQAAAGLGGQSGRSVSDKDIKHWTEVVGNPFAIDMHKQKYNQGLDYLDTLTDARTRVLNTAAGGNILGDNFESSIEQPYPSTGQQLSITPEQIDNMTEEELDAFLVGG